MSRLAAGCVAYPASAELTQSPFWDHPHIHANLIYLQEHQLIDGTLVNGNMEIWNPGITAKGLDFLEDDGGLSAILGAITVKLDPDDLRALIAARIEESDLPTEQRLRSAMRWAPYRRRLWGR